MFKPTLKRSKLDLHSTTQKMQQYIKKKEKNVQNHDDYEQMMAVPLSIIPRKILEPDCQGFFKLRKKLTCPLSSVNYPYPQQIYQQINFPTNQLVSQGIGQYDQVFWLYQNTKLTLWNYSQNYTKLNPKRKCVFDSPIYGVGMGILKNQNHNFSKDSINVVGVGFSSVIKLFELKQKKSLQIQDLRIVIRTQYSQMSQQIYFSEFNQIFIGGSTRILTMMSFKQQPKKLIPLSFSQKIVRFFSPWKENSTVLQIVSTSSKVYCLIKKNHPIPFISKASHSVKAWFTRKQYIQPSVRLIDVYDLSDNKITYLHSIQQETIGFKIKSNYAELQGQNIHDPYEIKSIYIDQQSDNLGVVLKCGYYALIKDTKNVSFWKQPFKIPKNPQFIGIDYPYQIKSKVAVDLNSHNSHQVQISKGFKNLTILNDMIIYLDDDRFYFLKYMKPIGEISQIGIKCSSGRNNQSIKSIDSSLPIIQAHKKWVLFDQDGFHIVCKPQPRDVILGYCSYSSTDLAVKRTNLKEQRINQKLQKLGNLYGHTQFCTYIFELLLLDKYSIRMNKQFNEFIRSEVENQNEKRRNFNEWMSVEIEDNEKLNVYQISKCKEKIWNVLIEYYNHPVTFKGEQGHNAMWHAVSLIFYKILQPTLSWTPTNFLQNKQKSLVISQRLEKFNNILQEFSKRSSYLSLMSIKDQLMGKDQTFKPHYNNHYNKSLILQNQTLDQTIPSNNITTSSIKLCQIIQASIPKIRMLMKIYEYLGDVENRYRQFPQFIKVLHDNHARKILKQAIMTYMRGPIIKDEMIQLIKSLVPELQIDQDITYARWKQFMKRMSPQDVDLEKLSAVISISQLPQLRDYFQNYQQKYLQLLICKIERLKKQNNELHFRNQLYSDGNYFQKEQAKFIGQNRYYIELDILTFRNHLEQFIQGIFKRTQSRPYPNSSDKKFPYQNEEEKKYSMVVEKIIKIVVEKADAEINEQTQRILQQYELCQFYYFMKKHKESLNNKKTLKKINLSKQNYAQKGLGLNSVQLQNFIYEKQKKQQQEQSQEKIFMRNAFSNLHRTSEDQMVKTYKKKSTLNKQTQGSYDN